MSNLSGDSEIATVFSVLPHDSIRKVSTYIMCSWAKYTTVENRNLTERNNNENKVMFISFQ